MIIIDLPYDTIDFKSAEKWLEQNIGPYIGIIQTGGTHGIGWQIYHTTNQNAPYQAITRVKFRLKEDAILFQLAWL